MDSVYVRNRRLVSRGQVSTDLLSCVLFRLRAITVNLLCHPERSRGPAFSQGRRKNAEVLRCAQDDNLRMVARGCAHSFFLLKGRHAYPMTSTSYRTASFCASPTGVGALNESR